MINANSRCPVALLWWNLKEYQPFQDTPTRMLTVGSLMTCPSWYFPSNSGVGQAFLIILQQPCNYFLYFHQWRTDRHKVIKLVNSAIIFLASTKNSNVKGWTSKSNSQIKVARTGPRTQFLDPFFILATSLYCMNSTVSLLCDWSLLSKYLFD